MKLKAIKAHYYESKYIMPGGVYYADVVHSGIVLRSGVCEEMETLKSQKVEKTYIDFEEVIEDKILKETPKKKPFKKRK